MRISNNFGVAWVGEEGERAETKRRVRRVMLRGRKRKIESEQRNFWGRHHGPAREALSLSLRHGDRGVTNGRLTCNGSHFQSAVRCWSTETSAASDKS